MKFNFTYLYSLQILSNRGSYWLKWRRDAERATRCDMFSDTHRRSGIFCVPTGGDAYLDSRNIGDLWEKLKKFGRWYIKHRLRVSPINLLFDTSNT